MTEPENDKLPQINKDVYNQFANEAASFIDGDHETLGSMIYSVIKALHDAGMTVFFSAAATANKTLEMCSGAQGDIATIGTIAGFQLGQVLRKLEPDEAHACLDAFIYGIEEAAPQIEAQVEKITRRKKGN